MANELQPRPLGQVSAIFAGRDVKDTLGAGIAASFAVMGYKGKIWSIRYRGEETKLLRAEGDPIASIEAIIVASADHLSKLFYEGGYQEGNTNPPDCFSNDGIVPDAASPKKQNPVCATCPKNAWGSAVNAATGGKGKACGDFKRTAIVPLADPKNEVFGGPMLLRIPAASLQDAASYADHCAKMGYRTYEVGSRIGFNVNESFPKFTWHPLRALSDDEAKVVVEHQDSDVIKRVLAETAIDQVTNGVKPEPVAIAPVQQAQPAPVQAPIAAPPPPKQETPKASGFTAPTAAAQPSTPVITPEVTPTVPTSQGNGTVETASSPSPQTAEDFERSLEERLAALMPPPTGDPVGVR